MHRKLHKKGVIIAVVMMVIALTAGSAFAYYLIVNEGSGSGTATSSPLPAASGTPIPLTVTGNASTTGVTPGGSIPFHVLIAPVNSGDIGKTATTATATVTSISVDAAHVTAGCLSSWFVPDGGYTIGTPFSFVTSTVLTAAPIDLAQQGGAISVDFTNTATNQGACQGATVSLAITLS